MSAMLTMRKFERCDNSTIASWFKDSDSKRWLESAWSESELIEIENEPNGRVYVAELNGILVGTIGCYLGLNAGRIHHISEIHVNPPYRRLGIAREMLRWIVTEMHQSPMWEACVEFENCSAVGLFESDHWAKILEDDTYMTYRKTFL